MENYNRGHRAIGFLRNAAEISSGRPALKRVGPKLQGSGLAGPGVKKGGGGAEVQRPLENNGDQSRGQISTFLTRRGQVYLPQ